MKTIIEIKSVMSAQGQTGKQYFKVETDQGLMTTFDQEIAKALSNRQLNGQLAEVNIIKKEKDGKTYVNIKGIDAAIPKKEDRKLMEPPVMHNPVNLTQNKAHKAMIISYVKDLIVADKLEVNQFRHWVEELWNIYNEV